MDSLLLYATPLVCRVALDGWRTEAWRVAVSLAPLALVLPSIWLPRWIPDEEKEHVARHALYALAFTVSVATGVRWDRVASLDDAPWRWPIVAYAAVGTATLWWFCLSHVLENARRPFALLHTHQGDVVVLPLTLVAIGSFASSGPDEAFQYSRAMIFYVPVVVAWATLFFVAFTGFATSATTTHTAPGFQFLASAALVVAAAHLTLLEVRAPSLAFQFFPVVAALLCQVTPRPSAPPALYERHWLPSAVVGGVLGYVLGLVLFVDAAVAIAATAYACAVASAAAPRVAGERWVLPATCYTALLLAAALPAVDRPAVVLATAGGCYVVFVLVSYVAPAVRPWPHPETPPVDDGARPQAERTCSLSKCLLSLDLPLPAWRRYDADVVRRFFDRVDPGCPRHFVGVWWMDGNTFPMDLVCVHRLRWSSTGAPTATMWNRRDTTRRTTLGGMLMQLTSWFTQTCIVVEDEGGGRWIRTDAWALPPLRLAAHTYWLYRTADDDVMLRLVYDREGRLVWQYRMVRIARSATQRTRFYEAWRRECEGRGYVLAL
jgi:hypothetical protein